MNRLFKYAAVLLVIVNGIFPALWLLLTSFKTDGELRRLPITYLPENFTLAKLRVGLFRKPVRALFAQLGGRVRLWRRCSASFSPGSPVTRSGDSICRDAA